MYMYIYLFFGHFLAIHGAQANSLGGAVLGASTSEKKPGGHQTHMYVYIIVDLPVKNGDFP